MNQRETIFVYLPDEKVDVWRRVQAKSLGNGLFRIVEQPYNRVDERWQFEPGDVVRCKHIVSETGTILAAVERANVG